MYDIGKLKHLFAKKIILNKQKVIVQYM